MSAEIRAAVRAARAARINVVAPREDGSKRPIGKEWEQYQQRRSTPEELNAWYANGRTALGGVTGKISDNLELFEFDDGATYAKYKPAAVAAGLGPLIERVEQGYGELTPGGGVHWFFRCEEIGGNTKLARRPGPPDESGHPTVETLIETKGEGGYAVLAPSFGRVHPTGGAYRVLAGSFDTIATIAPDERGALFGLARTFDEMPRREYAPPDHAAASAAPDRPGDDFNARATWDEVLAPHGWKRLFSVGEKTLWRRPGKDRDWSATTNHGGYDRLFVFTSSTPFDSDRYYKKFGAYAILNHAGDFRAAAAELGRRGYGARLPVLELDGAEREGAAAAEAARIDPNAYHQTDTGNAELLAAMFGAGLRYDHRRGEWLRWAGHRWERGAEAHVHRLAKAVARARLRAAADVEGDEQRKKAVAWALASESRQRLEALVDRARYEDPIADDGLGWDADPLLLGVPNGVVDLRTGALRDGRKEDRITLWAGAPYDPDAAAPRWERFLREVFRDDDALIDYVRRAAGYSITGDTSEQVLFVNHGKGSNGKGVMFRGLTHALGEYAHNTPFSTLEAHERGAQPTNDLAALVGRRFVTASETNESRRLNEARVKSLTGQDPITARSLYKEFFTFTPVAKFWLAVNHRPRVADDSHGFWRRVREIPFLAQFTEGRADRTLDDTLKAEAPGVLAWAVRGCLEWRREGLATPLPVREATEDYRRESDPLADFFAERCVCHAGATVAAGALYKAYIGWTSGQGLRDREVLSAASFGRRVGERFAKIHTKAGKQYVGIGLKGDDPGGGDGFAEPNPSPDLASVGAENGAAEGEGARKMHKTPMNPPHEGVLCSNPSNPSPDPKPVTADGWAACASCGERTYTAAGQVPRCARCRRADGAN